MIETRTLNVRFERLQADILELWRERDEDIMNAESEELPEYKRLKPEIVAEMRAERLKYFVQVKLNSKERFTSQVEDFLASLHTERSKRMYPYQYATSHDLKRRSAELDARARAFVQAVGTDAERFKLEIERASEDEYVSRLIEWAELNKTFDGDLPALEIFLEVRDGWTTRLELAELDHLVKRCEELRERMRQEYLLLENGMYGKSKDFRAWEEKMDLLARDQADPDEPSPGVIRGALE